MVNYICPIFWFATQTFNRGEKKEYKLQDERYRGEI